MMKSIIKVFSIPARRHSIDVELPAGAVIFCTKDCGGCLDIWYGCDADQNQKEVRTFSVVGSYEEIDRPIIGHVGLVSVEDNAMHVLEIKPRRTDAGKR